MQIINITLYYTITLLTFTVKIGQKRHSRFEK